MPADIDLTTLTVEVQTFLDEGYSPQEIRWGLTARELHAVRRAHIFSSN